MQNMDEIINELDKLSSEITHVRSLVKKSLPSKEQEKTTSPEHKYYTLKEAVALKYGNNVAYTTVSTNMALMPCCNKNYIKTAGKRMWNKQYIDEWLNISDADIPLYAKKYNAKLPEKLMKKYGIKEITN